MQTLDPVGLVARALAAWAAEHTAVVSSASCVDPVTGLVNGGYLRARLRELHDQCGALAIAPPMTFGALVVQLELGAVRATERMSVRFGAGRTLTVCSAPARPWRRLGATRMVGGDAGLRHRPRRRRHRDRPGPRIELAARRSSIDRRPFGDDANAT